MKKKRGIAIVIVMLSLSLLAVTTLAITYLSNRSLMQSKVLAETDEAFFSAQAALNLKVAELRSGDEVQKTGQMTDSDAHYDVKVYLQGDSVTELPSYSVPPDHYYVVSKGYDRDPALSGPKPREVVVGALFQKSATVFTAAALAGTKLDISDDAYTDTVDPATLLPGNHALANVGVFNPSAEVNIASSSYVGRNGSTGAANILLPTGFAGSVTAPVGNYAAQTVSPFLSPPPPVPSRTPGSATLDTNGTPTITPTLVGGEYVVKYDILKAHGGGKIRLDVSSVPDGETVYVDVVEFNLDGGTFEVFDSDEADYDAGSATKVDVHVYATSKFDVTNLGRFLTLNDEPRRLVAYCEGDMTFNKLATSYFIGRSRTKVQVLETSEIFGAILSDGEVIIKDAGSAVHYDPNLVDSGGGATGAGTLIFVSYQRLQ